MRPYVKNNFWVDIFYKEKIGPTEKILIIIGLYKLLGPTYILFFILIRVGYYLIIIYSVHAISWVLFSIQGST